MYIRKETLRRVYDSTVFEISQKHNLEQNLTTLNVIEHVYDLRGISLPKVKNSTAALLRLRKFYTRWALGPNQNGMHLSFILGRRNAVLGELIKRGALKQDPRNFITEEQAKRILSKQRRKKAALKRQKLVLTKKPRRVFRK